MANNLHNNDNNMAPPLDYSLITDFIDTGSGITNTVMCSLVNSEHDNPLRQTLINQLNNDLHRKIKSKKFNSKLTIPEQLTSEQQNKLQTSYDDVELVFTNSTVNDHAFAAASRRCERNVLLSKLNVDLNVDHHTVILKDVGGNPVASALGGEYNVHSCCPILSPYDSTRATNRYYQALKTIESEYVKNDYVKSILQSYVSSFKNLENNLHFCFNKAQKCTVKAEAMMMLHSNYDVKLEALGDMMDTASALVTYGSFIYGSRILTDDHGYLDGIESDYLIERNILGNRSKIRFGFKGCNGFNYHHDYDTYMSYLTTSQFQSRSGNYYTLELLENRNNIQFFRVTRLFLTVGMATNHRLYLPHLNNKYLIRYPKVSYFFKNSVLHYPKAGNVVDKALNIDNKFWRNLPKNVQWIYYEVDADVVDRTCAYVLGATEEKFKPEQIITYIRSITTREIMYSSVIVRRELPRLDDLSALTYAIYLTLYQAKYIYGKTLQQAILNINATRQNQTPKNVLTEFDRNKTILEKLFPCLFGRKDYNFDSNQLILRPSEYLEISTSSGGPVIINDLATLSPVQLKDIIPLSKVLEKVNPALTLPVPNLTVKEENLNSNGVLTIKTHSKGVIRQALNKVNNLLGKAACPNISRKNAKFDSIPSVEKVEKKQKRRAPLPPVKSIVKRKAPLPPTTRIIEQQSSTIIIEEKSKESALTNDDGNIPPVKPPRTKRSKLRKSESDESTGYSSGSSDTTDSYKDAITMYDNYFRTEAKKTSPGWKCKHGLNRAYSKLFDLMPYIKKNFSNDLILDCCGAPGGFLAALLDIGVDPTNITSFSAKGIEYDESLLTTGINIQVTTLLDFRLNRKTKYDIILADGAVENSYKDPSLFEEQWALIKSALNEDGSMIIKHNNFYDHYFLDTINNIARYFTDLLVIKPFHSLITNTEIYLVGNGFSCNPTNNKPQWLKPKLVLYNLAKEKKRTLECKFTENKESLKVKFNPEKIYPRLGYYNSVTQLINVDGSKLECCYLAAMEDRSMSVDLLKEILSKANPKPYADLEQELKPGAKGGTAFLEAYANYYGVGILLMSSFGTMRIPDSTFNETFRKITLVLKDDHYYIRSVCKMTAPIKYRRDNMFEPFNLLQYKAKLMKIIDVKCLNAVSELDLITKSGLYHVNNLAKYCNLHDQCKNNNVLQTIKHIQKFVNINVAMVHVIEMLNFDPDHVQSVIKDTDISVRFIELDYPGYLTLIFYRSEKPVQEIVPAYTNFVNHTCEDGKQLMYDFENNILYTCGKVTKQHHERQHQPAADLTIKIQRNTTTSLVAFKGAHSLVLNGKGISSVAENMPLIAKEVADYLLAYCGTKYMLVHLISEYTNIKLILNAVIMKTRFLTTDIRGTTTIDKYMSFDYYPDVSELNKRCNSMIEAYSIWYNEKKIVEETLRAGFNTIVGAIKNGDQICSKSDNSLVVLDVNSGKYVYGVRLNPPYAWGFDGKNLINTEALFDSTGKLNSAVLRNYRTENKQYVVFNASSKLIHGISLSHNLSLENVKSLKEIPIVFVQGVPGGGKTSYILDKNKESTNNLILTVTREAKEDMTSRAKQMQLMLSSDRIKTVDSFLVNPSRFASIDEVWIDEALLIHCGVWNWVAVLSNCNKLVVVGDQAQIPYINRSGMEIHYNRPDQWNTERQLLKVDYRNPLDIVYWLNTSGFYDFEVKGTSELLHSVALVKISGVPEIVKTTSTRYITFTQSEKATLVSQGFDANTIHEFQGSQHSEIALVRLNQKEADRIYDSMPHILVALTRHRVSLTYYTVVQDRTSAIINKIQTYPKTELLKVKFDGRAGGRKIMPDKTIVLYKQEKVIRDILLSVNGSGYTNWSFDKVHEEKFKQEPKPVTGFFQPSIAIFQDYIDRIYRGSASEFREVDHYNFEYHAKVNYPTGVMTSLALPVFKPYDRLTPSVRTTIQYPLHKSQRVALKAFFERNGQVPQLQGLINDTEEARKLIVDFKLLCPFFKDFSDKPIRPDFKGLEEWLEGQPPSIRRQLTRNELFQDQNFSVYDFMTKIVPKIDLDMNAEFKYKAPQTIAYQAKIINSVFCPLLKEMMNRVEFSLHDDIILYNRMSANQFADIFSERLPITRYQMLSKFIEIDFSKYDKSQGLAILIFEAMLMEEFGVDAYYIALWIIMHRYTRIRDRFNKISAFVEYQRKSGDAGTWRLNTVVQIAILNRVLKLHEVVKEGKLVACFSGDDSLMFMDELPQNLGFKMHQLQCIYNLEAKLMNFSVPYFCSKFLIIKDNEWIFVPDTVKLIIKLGRADMVDSEHVEAYRISFSDNLYYYKFPENWTSISLAINNRYKIYGEHDILFMALLEVIKTPESFAKLYYEGPNFKQGMVSSKPSLEL